MAAGFLAAVGAAVVGHLKIRKRRDLPRNLWLTFWRSRAGEWLARLAAFRLGSPEVEAFERASNESNQDGPLPAIALMAASRIERIRDCLERMRTLETEGLEPLPPSTVELRRQLEASNIELQKLRDRAAGPPSR